MLMRKSWFRKLKKWGRNDYRVILRNRRHARRTAFHQEGHWMVCTKEPETRFWVGPQPAPPPDVS